MEYLKDIKINKDLNTYKLYVSNYLIQKYLRKLIIKTPQSVTTVHIIIQEEEVISG